MKPTLDKVRELVGWTEKSWHFAVEKTDDGIRVHADHYTGDDPELLGRVMRAALAMQLDPRQVVGEFEYDGGDSCPTCGYDASFGMDVTFLFEPAKG